MGYLCLPLWAAFWVRFGSLLLSDTTTVPERLRSLKQYWPRGAGDGTMAMVKVIMLSIAIAGTAAFLYKLFMYLSKSSKNTGADKIASRVGLTEQENRLLHTIVSSKKKTDLKRLLTSTRRFDEQVGLYLRKYCAHQSEPGVVLRALQVLRNKITSGRSIPASGLPGIGKLTLLSELSLMNLNRPNEGMVQCQIIENLTNRLRMVGLPQARRETWRTGDLLKVEGKEPNGEKVELLVKFKSVESTSRSVFVVLFDYPCEEMPFDGTNPQVKYPVRLTQKARPSVLGQLIKVTSAWSHVLTKQPLSVGEGVYLSSEEDDEEGGALSTLIYCYRSHDGRRFEVGLYFDGTHNPQHVSPRAQKALKS
ncbi:MAG: hypothetical protein ACYTG7_10360 [Planctomycetota bacterium]